MVEHPTEATVVLGAVRDGAGEVVDWRYLEANACALAMLGRTREDVLGRLVSDVLPDRAVTLIPLCARVLQTRTPHHYRTERGGRSFEVQLFALGGEIVVSNGADITERLANERRLEARLAADRAEKDWLAAVLDSLGEQVFFVDTAQRFTYLNPAARRAFEHDIVGRTLHEVISAVEIFRANGSPRPFEETPALRALGGEIIRGEEQILRLPGGEVRYRLMSSAPVRDAEGRILGSVSVLRDITEERQVQLSLRAREARTAALLTLSDRFRDATDPEDIALSASLVLHESLGISRCGYGTIDVAAETVTIGRHWSAPHVPRLQGAYHMRAYGNFVDELKRGETVVVTDTRKDALTAHNAEPLAGLGVRSLVNLPIVERGRTVAMFFLTHHEPREWTGEELQFIRDVAERTRSAVERRRSEQAMANELRVTRVLQELGAKIVAEGEADKLFDEVLSAARTITAADAATLQLLDAGGRTLHLAATQGVADSLRSRFEVVDSTSGSPCGVALVRGQRVLLNFDIPEAEDPDGSAQAYLEQGLRSGQSTPLVGRSGAALGMLSTHWRQRHVLDERESRFLDLLARQAADLIEKTRAEQALRRQQEELRTADRRKDEFLAVLAHELRNPLVPIRTGMELLRQAADRPELLERVRPMMERQTLHMVRLIDDLLDVSRITAGKIQLQREPVSLGDVVGSALEANRGGIEAAGLALEIEITEPWTRLNVDPTRVAQIITNLLHNATKFTPAGGRVRVEARVEEHEGRRGACVRVSDDGIGIAAELLPRVFELFIQGERPGQRSHGGLGIGLALARSLATMHGGELTARSGGMGQGSEFTLRLPVAAEAGIRGRAAEVHAGSLQGRRVLVVDDSRDGADSLALLLGGLGAEVSVAYDGASALDQFALFAPAVVVLDIGMPVMDGYETCRRLRAVAGEGLRVIALTGWGQKRDRDLALEAGFDAHLTKPAGPADLVAALTAAR